MIQTTSHRRAARRLLPAALLAALGFFLTPPPARAAHKAPVSEAARVDAPSEGTGRVGLDAEADAPAAPKIPKAAMPAAGRKAPKRQKTEFLRFIEDKKGGGKLESAIATYRNADGVEVHLVAALHVGEKSYYDSLTESFATYDALLYELIKPKGAGVPVRGVKAPGMLSAFQRFLKDTLELEFQLDAIDYSPANFVHADLDAETFLKLQKERGESIFSLMLRSMLSEMNRQGEGKGAKQITLFDLLGAMNSPDSARQYKLLLARQFEDLEAQMAGMEGENGSVILTERNKAAVKVLKKTIEAGKSNIGVFYGAAHMRGIEDSLVKKMGFTRTGLEWRVAWDMTPRPKAKPTVPIRRAEATPETPVEDETEPAEAEAVGR